MGALLPPVMGSLLEHRVGGEVRRRVYVSGDTLTGDHVSEIARRHPDIDVAVVHLGGTRVLLHIVTMDAEQGVNGAGRKGWPSSSTRSAGARPCRSGRTHAWRGDGGEPSGHDSGTTAPP